MQYIYIDQVILITSNWDLEKIDKKAWKRMLGDSILSKRLVKIQVLGVRKNPCTCVIYEPEVWLDCYWKISPTAKTELRVKK